MLKDFDVKRHYETNRSSYDKGFSCAALNDMLTVNWQPIIKTLRTPPIIQNMKEFTQK